eukprot:TRINITY_DN23939_c0_g1_i1.p1 TRINITY_DN23939_c0_g1~~TRINITY_DN23939_c0_g1_i1.p1  ORF type:complete len:506 (+),score=66.22 TRINITY_DN23939_c0_g1_i1:174-1691(+)
MEQKHGKAEPLLSHEPRHEEPTSSRKSSWKEWLGRKWQLLLYTVLLLLSSVGNTVYFKRMTTAMPNYGWYLTQLSTFIYVPFFAVLAGTNIWRQADRDLVRKFGFMGIFDGLSGTFMVLGGVHTSGTLQVMLGQAVIPLTLLLSALLLGKRYHALQYVGAGTIVLGIVVAKAGSSGPDIEDENLPVFNALFCLALLPSALSTVFKEIAFRGFDGDLDANVLQFWVAAFQVVTNFLAVPVYTLKMLGPQQMPLSHMASTAREGTKCLFLMEDQVVTQCGQPGEKPCDHCGNAYVSVFLYLAFNLALNIFSILVIKHGSAALSFLVSTLRMPLSALAFSSTFIMGAEAVSPGLGDFFSLAIILAGLCSYRFGARQIKRQLRMEAESAEGEAMMSPSPRNSWASPSSSPLASPRGSTSGEGERSRWQFMPILTAGSVGNTVQPQFLLVHAPRAKARSAEQVRSGLIRRLGAASPLHSPRLRNLSPQGSSHPGAGHTDIPDFSLTGLPP